MPVTSVCKVIEAVLEHLGNVTVDYLPDPRTVSYFAYELGIISDKQVGEILYDNDNVTLSWDSTSVEGHHINEVHISIATVPPTSYVLPLGTLAGGTTDDYASHIQACITGIVRSYAEYHKPDPVQTKSTIIHHLTLSDRVAVNHCVVQSFNHHLKLNC